MDNLCDYRKTIAIGKLLQAFRSMPQRRGSGSARANGPKGSHGQAELCCSPEGSGRPGAGLVCEYPIINLTMIPNHGEILNVEI